MLQPIVEKDVIKIMVNANTSTKEESKPSKK